MGIGPIPNPQSPIPNPQYFYHSFISLRYSYSYFILLNILIIISIYY
ncbi:MAG: hypothetical protein MJ252_10205 [archaeon]|nr:hypothetical protein [archaeon]